LIKLSSNFYSFRLFQIDFHNHSRIRANPCDHWTWRYCRYSSRFWWYRPGERMWTLYWTMGQVS